MEAGTDAGTLHMKEFLEAVRSRQQPSCTTEDARQSTATVQLAMASYESATSVGWDESKMRVMDNKAAARLLQRDYRSPWKHPYRG